jgi:hypothetical protein
MRRRCMQLRSGRAAVLLLAVLTASCRDGTYRVVSGRWFDPLVAHRITRSSSTVDVVKALGPPLHVVRQNDIEEWRYACVMERTSSVGLGNLNIPVGHPRLSYAAVFTMRSGQVIDSNVTIRGPG